MLNLRRNENDLTAKVVTLFSTASATGKTVLAISFAAALAERGFRVCLADFDFQYGDVANYLQLEPSQGLFKLYHDDSLNAADAVETTAWKFDVLPAPAELDEGYLITPDRAIKALKQLMVNYDYVIVDTDTSFSDLNFAVLENTDMLFIPCVVDFLPTIKNMKMGLDMAKRMKFDPERIRLILNRNNAMTKISINDVEGLLGAKFRYLVSNDYKAIVDSIKAAMPLILNNNSKIAQEISDIINVELGGSKRDGGWLSKLWR